MRLEYLKYLFCIFILFACNSSLADNWYFQPSDVNKLHHKEADYRIAYGNSPEQFAELRLPKNQNLHPVIILIHGGCWTSKFADLSNTATLADALRDLGFATWNIEYRRVDNEGGGFPGTFEDIANATDYLKNISQTYSLDLNHVIVIGHSAGGHLALWLSARQQIPKNSPLYKPNPLKLNAVISMGGVPDLASFRKEGVRVCGKDVVAELLGKTEDEIQKHYLETSPIELLPFQIPQILMYGSEDPVTPPNIDEYVKTAMNKGDKVKLITIPLAGHHEYNVPNSVVWPFLKKQLLELFKI